MKFKLFQLIGLAIAFGHAQLAFAQNLTFLPLATVVQNSATSLEQTNIMSLVAEGLSSTSAILTDTQNLANQWCNMTGGTAQGCSTETTTIAPILAELQTEFLRVPVAQWNPATFDNSLPNTAKGYIPAPPAPAPAPVGTNVVGQCYPVSGVNSPTGTICNPGPAALAPPLVNGQMVMQNGVMYVTHINQGLFGQQIIFEPFGGSAN